VCHLDLHSFPTRRSSDLRREGRHAAILQELELPVPFDLSRFTAGLERQRWRPIPLHPFSFGPGGHGAGTTPFHATHIALHEIARSEEHTSELQSLAYLVC